MIRVGKDWALSVVARQADVEGRGGTKAGGSRERKAQETERERHTQAVAHLLGEERAAAVAVGAVVDVVLRWMQAWRVCKATRESVTM